MKILSSQTVVRILKLLELIIAIILAVAIVIASVSLFADLCKGIHFSTFDLNNFLGNALTIVIGIEFVKMLILHTPGAVLEVLLYAIARQVIMSHESAMENLIGVSAVAILFLIRKYCFVSSFSQGDNEEV